MKRMGIVDLIDMVSPLEVEQTIHDMRFMSGKVHWLLRYLAWKIYEGLPLALLTLALKNYLCWKIWSGPHWWVKGLSREGSYHSASKLVHRCDVLRP